MIEHIVFMGDFERCQKLSKWADKLGKLTANVWYNLKQRKLHTIKPVKNLPKKDFLFSVFFFAPAPQG